MTLDDIRKLIEAATPGPWKDDGDWHSWTEDQGYATSWVETPKGDWRQYGPDTGSDMVQQKDDARFIAAARTLLPALLEVAEWSEKLAAYVEDCYPGIQVTGQIREALAALEALKLP